MKHQKFNKKLSLNKLTVASLDTREQQALKGGYLETKIYTYCYTWYPICFTMPKQYCETLPEFCEP